MKGFTLKNNSAVQVQVQVQVHVIYSNPSNFRMARIIHNGYYKSFVYSRMRIE